METFEVEGRTVQIILVKNPTGFNQVLQHLGGLSGTVVPAFLINDQLADGTDISWLWDVDFERFAAQAGNMPAMVVSGIRRDDMAVRLKYAGVPESGIQVKDAAEPAFQAALAATPAGGTLCVMPTYTALLELRGLLSRQYGLKAFWK
jgi:UDP-N-acetylmuramyl tripeptide synthase